MTILSEENHRILKSSLIWQYYILISPVEGFARGFSPSVRKQVKNNKVRLSQQQLQKWIFHFVLSQTKLFSLPWSHLRNVTESLVSIPAPQALSSI